MPASFTSQSSSSYGAQHDLETIPVVSIRTHRGSGERQVTLDDLKRVAHLSQERAAAALNVGNTRFKSACRELGMRGWPYRKIKSVRSLQRTVEVNLVGYPEAQVEGLLRALEVMVETHFHNPTLALDDEFKSLRQAAYKRKHGQKRQAGCSSPAPDSHQRPRGSCALACGAMEVQDTSRDPVETRAPVYEGGASPATPPKRERRLAKQAEGGAGGEKGGPEPSSPPRSMTPMTHAFAGLGTGSPLFGASLESALVPRAGLGLGTPHSAGSALPPLPSPCRGTAPLGDALLASWTHFPWSPGQYLKLLGQEMPGASGMLPETDSS